MAAIFVVAEPNQITRVFRTSRRSVVLGRAEEADLILPNISVSRMHASLEGQTLEALEDANPVLVNGTPLQAPVRLAHGDEVRLGKYRLTYYVPERLTLMQAAELEAMPPHVGRHPGAAGGAAATHAISAALHQRLAQQGQLREQAALVATDGTRWTLQETRTIGPGGDIPAVARLLRAPLAQVAWSGQAHVLSRRGWMGRVTVNGVAVKEQPLRPGDRVKVGQSDFTYGV